MLIHKVKNLLKKNTLISNANANLKCARLKYQYSKNIRKYNQIPQLHSLDELLLEKGFTSNWGKKKLNIYFIGTDESQDRGGFIQDLSALCNLTLFNRFDGSYGQYSGDLYYNGVQGRELNTNKIIIDIEKQINYDKPPDLVLMQAWGRTFEIDRLKSFKNNHGLKFVNISLDDRLVYRAKTPFFEKYNYGISGLNSITDLQLVSNKEAVKWYLKENIPALHFPMASSPRVFFPMNIEKKYDVGFIGNKYGYRSELIQYLISSGINVEARGSGWDSGRIDFRDNNTFFNECKIVLGVGTVGHCRDFYTQKLRDFDAPLSGSVYITHNENSLKDLYDKDKDILLCNNLDEFVFKIRSIIDDNEALTRIGDNAHKKARKFHTYEIRFSSLFKLLGAGEDV